MRKIDIVLLALNMAGAVIADPWIDGRNLPIEGRAFDDVDHYYDRLPSGVTTNVNAEVRRMKHNTAGMQFRFSTDSAKLRLKWTPYKADYRSGDNGTTIMKSGLDVYCRRPGTNWRYVGTGRVRQEGEVQAEFAWTPGDECLINLPLYNGIRGFSLGLDEGATVAPLPPRANGVTKPVVFYGTSITQGASAARPGLSFVNVIGRDLDVPVVNLGFSGAGKMELEMSGHLARIDASCYVLDCLWNMAESQVAERYEPFVRNLRAKRPDVPIVMAEQSDVHQLGPNAKDRRVRALYDRLVAEGWKRIVYLPKSGMYDGSGEGAIDGVHPNDRGMATMARAFGAAVAQCLGLPADACAHTAADVYPVPAGERIFDGCTVKVDGVPAPVSAARCSAMPFNRRWPGHQRSVDQTELTGFVRFAFSGKAHVEVTAAKDFRSVKVRPLAKGVCVARDGRTVAFDLTEPGAYSVEFDGCHGNLHVFADTPRDYGVDADAPNVRYYGPGEHDVGPVTLKSGETVYLDPGAVVYGRFEASNATDVAILGRGIIDASRIRERILFQPKGDEGWENAIENAERYHTLWMRDVRNLRIDGVTIRDSLAYNVALFNCTDIRIEDVKIVGQWRYNTDGIDLHNCRHAAVRGCFVRSYDDTLCAKSHHEWPTDAEDIRFEHCVLWNDWGKTLEVGAECQSDHLRNIVFRDCDVIHACGNVLDVSNVDYGEVSDVLYEDIRIEDDEPMPERQYQKSETAKFDPTRYLDALTVFSANIYFCAYSTERGFKYRGAGRVKGVTLRNIAVTSSRPVQSLIRGFDGDHRVTDVRIDNLRVNGVRARSAEDIGLREFRFADQPDFCQPTR